MDCFLLGVILSIENSTMPLQPHHFVLPGVNQGIHGFASDSSFGTPVPSRFGDEKVDKVPNNELVAAINQHSVGSSRLLEQALAKASLADREGFFWNPHVPSVIRESLRARISAE